jgi:hypothetical protein
MSPPNQKKTKFRQGYAKIPESASGNLQTVALKPYSGLLSSPETTGA